MNSKPGRCFTPILATLLSLSTAQAQTALTGALSGTVFDSKGSVVPGAQVLIKSASLTTTHESKTNASGRFTLLGLTPSGDYVLSVAAPQFRTTVLDDVNVISEQTAGVNVTLELAPVSGSITVSDESSPVETTAPEVSQRVDQRRLTELPSNGRNLAKFSLLDPHVRNTSGLGATAFRERGYRLTAHRSATRATNSTATSTMTLNSTMLPFRPYPYRRSRNSKSSRTSSRPSMGAHPPVTL